MEERIL
jgi:hypothetical protein